MNEKTAGAADRACARPQALSLRMTRSHWTQWP